MNVLFVCTGNICRSPMAEALFRAHLDGHDLPGRVSSAGLLAAGEPAASGARAVMAARAIDLRAHRSSVLTAERVDEADLVLAMERRHLREAVARRPGAFGRVFTLTDLVDRSRRLGGPTDHDTLDDWLARLGDGRTRRAQFADDPADRIDDPLGADADAFERTARRLDALIASLVGTMAMTEVRPLRVESLAPVR